MSGNGKATLTYGNCWKANDAYVKVYLNEKAIGRAAKDTPAKKVTFVFKDGDTLEIKDQTKNGIVRLESLEIECGKPSSPPPTTFLHPPHISQQGVCLCGTRRPRTLITGSPMRLSRQQQVNFTTNQSASRTTGLITIAAESLK
jgi:hypothetical protein